MKFKNCFMSLPRKRAKFGLAQGVASRPLGDVASLGDDTPIGIRTPARVRPASPPAGRRALHENGTPERYNSAGKVSASCSSSDFVCSSFFGG